MSARYRTIPCALWHDERFIALSDDAQLVYFHVSTNPYTNALGCYHMSAEGLAASKRWPAERYRQGLNELAAAGLVRYDERSQTVWFPDHLTRAAPDNPNILTGWLKSFDEVPASPLKNELYQQLTEQSARWGDAYSAAFAKVCADFEPYRNLPRTFPKPSANLPEIREREREQEREREREQEKERAEAAPPTAPREPAAPIAETQPTVSETPPAKTKKRSTEPMPECPDWLPTAIWQAFIAHRNDIKHRLTPAAAVLTLRDLDKARAFGHDPVDLIEDAIRNGWRGCVYADKHFHPHPPAKASAVPGGGRAAHTRVVPEPPKDRSQYHHTAGMATNPAWMDEESTA